MTKCRYPILIKDDLHSCEYYVPCGKCAWCRARLRNEWYFRFKMERKDCTRNRFVTFTYRDEDLPYVIDEDGCIIPSVCGDDVSKMIKKAHNNGMKFRYFLASEYSKVGRPHYHMLVFGNDKIDWSKFWDKGFVTDVPQNDGSLKYVTKYLLKGSNVPDGAVPNFRRMSRRPGIGYQFDYKGQKYLRTVDGVLPVGHYYRRRYLASLNEKLQAFEKSLTADYLKDIVDPFDKLRSVYDKVKPGVTFEEWLDYNYSKDYRAQIKINKK